jgi:hypothetical protein
MEPNRSKAAVGLRALREGDRSVRNYFVGNYRRGFLRARGPIRPPGSHSLGVRTLVWYVLNGNVQIAPQRVFNLKTSVRNSGWLV